jgi:Phosphatidylglycerol lysyltransferase, C-terminal
MSSASPPLQATADLLDMQTTRPAVPPRLFANSDQQAQRAQLGPEAQQPAQQARNQSEQLAAAAAQPAPPAQHIPAAAEPVQIRNADTSYDIGLPEMSSAADAVTRTNVASLLALHGMHGQTPLLDPWLTIFRVPHVVAHGAIGFRVCNGCAVVFGDPLCAPADAPALAAAFRAMCIQNAWPIVYVDASARFAQQVHTASSASAVAFGIEQWLSPVRFAKRLRVSSEAKKLQLFEYKRDRFPDARLERKIVDAQRSWLQGRSGPQIYTCDVQPFVAPEVRRWFYATRTGLKVAGQGHGLDQMDGEADDFEVVGVLGLIRIGSQGGGYVIDFCLDIPDAPKDTCTALALKTIKTLKTENCQLLTWGVAPKAELHNQEGSNRGVRIAQWLHCAALTLFHLHGKYQFRKKFCPHPTEGSKPESDVPAVPVFRRWLLRTWPGSSSFLSDTTSIVIGKQVIASVSPQRVSESLSDTDAKQTVSDIDPDAGGERKSFLVFDPPGVGPRSAIAIMVALHVTHEVVIRESAKAVLSVMVVPLRFPRMILRWLRGGSRDESCGSICQSRPKHCLRNRSKPPDLEEHPSYYHAARAVFSRAVTSTSLCLHRGCLVPTCDMARNVRDELVTWLGIATFWQSNRDWQQVRNVSV